MTKFVKPSFTVPLGNSKNYERIFGKKTNKKCKKCGENYRKFPNNVLKCKCTREDD